MTDTINILNTAYKNFDRYLSKYIGQKINCLVIGANNGDYSSWLLNNICTNIYSKVFSIDKWTDHILESVFDSNIDTTNKLNYHIKINKSIRKGLINLQKIKYVIFDVIIINTKTDDSNLISNTIIAWNLLNYNGIIIFDNYRDSYVEEEFKPKKSIDSFISMYRDQITKLDSEFQYIIEKKSNIKLKDIEEQKIIDIIDNYKFESFYMKFEENIDDDIEFRLANIELDENMNKINEIYKYIKNDNNKIALKQIKHNKILQYIIKYFKKNNIIINNINYINFIDMYIYYDLYNELVKNNKNYTNIFINSNKKEIDNIVFDNLFKNVNFNHKLHISFNTIDISEKTYLSLINSKNKYDFIYFNSGYKNIIYIIYIINIILNIQEINGVSIIHVQYVSININILIEIIYLLKKYYKKLIIKNRNSKYLGTYLIFKCKYLKDINKSELTNFKNIILELLKSNNSYSINSILNVNNNNFNIINYRFLKNYTFYLNNMNQQFNKFTLIINNLNNNNIKKKLIYRLIFLYIIIL